MNYRKYNTVDKKSFVDCNFTPRTTAYYTKISKRGSDAHTAFLKLYQNRCVYCGKKNDNITGDGYHIDHFKPHNDKAIMERYHDIYNLVFSCEFCNGKKGNEEFTDEFHPDTGYLDNFYSRNEFFEITFEELGGDIQKFYEKMEFYDKRHKINYLVEYLEGKEYNDKMQEIIRTLKLTKQNGKHEKTKLLIPSGNHSELKIFEDNTSTIRGHYFKRSVYKKLKEFDNTENACIYFLLHTDSDDVSHVYIGQSVNGFKRIDNHDSNKVNQVEGYLFNSTNGSWSKTVIDYLEYHYIEFFKGTEYVIENDGARVKPTVGIYEKADIDEYIK